MVIRHLRVDKARKKCSCGRKILAVRTAKSSKPSREHQQVSPKKTTSSVRATIRALTPLAGRKGNWTDDDKSTKKTAKTGSTISNPGEDAVCAKCQKMNMTTTTNELPPTNHLPKPKRTNKRRKLPIIERLRIVKVSSASISDRSRRRKCRPKRHSEHAGPLPNEVYIEQSALGFDGISPSSTMLKKIPTRFTFDDVVPSNSSIATADLTENHHVREHRGSAHILGDLMMDKTQLDKKCNTGDMELQNISNTKDVAVQPPRERSVTSSTIDTEMDSNDLDNNSSTKALEDKSKIMFPSNRHEHGDHDISYNGTQDVKNTENGKEQPALGWLFGFSLLAIK